MKLFNSHGTTYMYDKADGVLKIVIGVFTIGRSQTTTMSTTNFETARVIFNGNLNTINTNLLQNGTLNNTLTKMKQER